MFRVQEKNVEEFGFLPGEKVADLGAGAGHYTLPLARILGREGQVIAIDLKADLLIRLQNLGLDARLDNIEILEGDVEKEQGTHLVSDLLHGAVLASTLSQVRDKSATLREAARIVKPGGKVCVVDWKDKLPSSEVKNLATSLGLTFVREFEAGEGHYGTILRK